MAAPEAFVDWLSRHEHKDKLYGWAYNYHSRSDAHSIALCKFILQDLLAASRVMRTHAKKRQIVYGINAGHTFPSGKAKTLDLAIGTLVETPPLPVDGMGLAKIKRVLISCEAKAVMTEHSKSQPRIFDELSSSHEIVHNGDNQAIAAGITVVNIAATFVSPLRQKNAEALHISQHKQPRAAQRMVNHLRGLPIRTGADGVGFDAYSTIVVDCDNQGPATLWTEMPAPQPGDSDYYSTFIDRIARAYEERFGPSQ